MENKYSDRKLIINILLIILITTIVISVVFKGEDKRELWTIVKSADKLYVTFGIFLSLIYIFGEATNIRLLLKIFGYKIGFFRSMKYSFAGFFFSSITPSATGGQPMQMYYMKKDKIDVSYSSLILLIELLNFQLVTLLFGIISFIWADNIGIIDTKSFKYLVITGIIIDLVGVVFLNICIFNPKASKLLYKLVKRILLKLKFIKTEKKEKILGNIEDQIIEYNRCANYIKENMLVMLKVFIVTVFQMSSLFGISFMVYKALGGNKASFLDITLIQSLIYIGSFFIPIPGAMGVSENNFLKIFSKVYDKKLLNGGLILSRGISFYLLLIISGCALLISKFIKLYKKRELNL